MRRWGLFFVPLVLTACQACLDDDQLVALECAPGTVEVCDYNGNIITSLDPKDPPEIPGVCRYGFRTCTFDGWGECIGAVGPSEEVCDGLDNDCNAAVDETFPEQHQLCGFVEGADYGVGICTPGVMKCDNGGLSCDGHVGPSEEV